MSGERPHIDGENYATPSDLAFRLGRDAAPDLYQVIEAASRRIDSYTGRVFGKYAEPSTRLFRAQDYERLRVDDFYSLEDLAVVVDGVTWDEADYEPGSNNPIGFDGWPFTDLYAVSRSWPIRRRATIEVTARWGWEYIPAGIEEATLRLGKVIAERSGLGKQEGAVSSETIGGYSISYHFADTTSKGEVPWELEPAAPYRRKRFGVA